MGYRRAQGNFSPALGHALMDLALALLAYAVLAYRSLLPTRVARRTFYRSLLGGLLTALYIGAAAARAGIANRIIQPRSQLPLVTVATIIVLIAIFGPLRDWAGAWIDRRFFHREFDYGRLLRVLSDDLFQRGDLQGQLQAALTSICRTLALRDGAVAIQEGLGLRVLATYGSNPPSPEALRAVVAPETPQTRYGDWEAWPAARLLLPLRRERRDAGAADAGREAFGRAISRDRAGAAACARRLSVAHDQARPLAAGGAAGDGRAGRAEPPAPGRARAAGGPGGRGRPRRRPAAHPGRRAGARPASLRARAAAGRARWRTESSAGAATRPAPTRSEALFAFLFDRRGRGVTKDEAEEVIWPDLELDKSDTAFHRTISALRRTLEPGLKRGNESKLVTYHHERYWLDPAAMAWCDADAFAAAAERGHTLMRQGDLEAARTLLAEALELYRGDYMDDCPFFGNSTYVEGRRTELRDQRIDALLALGVGLRAAGPGRRGGHLLPPRARRRRWRLPARRGRAGATACKRGVTP